MRIVFDLNRCLGYAQCIPLAPHDLKLNGEEAVTYNPNPDDSRRQQVLRAVASCPVQAIMVDFADRGAAKGADKAAAKGSAKGANKGKGTKS